MADIAATATTTIATESSTHWEWWLAELPRVLMATVALLVDCLFRLTSSGRHPFAKDQPIAIRIQCQVLLWLTASLPSSFSSTGNSPQSLMFEALLHAVFATNVMCIGIETMLEKQRFASQFVKGHDSTPLNRLSCCGLCVRSPTNNHHNHTNASLTPILYHILLQSLAPSLWVALLVAYGKGPLNHSTQQENLQAFIQQYAVIVSGVYIMGVTLMLMFRRQKAKKILNQPDRFYRHNANGKYTTTTTTATASQGLQLQESEWHQWTVKDVMEWLSATFIVSETSQEQPYHYFETVVLPRLHWERIDGPALEYLDRPALRDMGIPFGVAGPLVAHIQTQLIQRYPRRPIQQNDWEDNDNSQQAESLVAFSDEHSYKSHQPTTYQPYMDQEEMEQIRSSMMQRFGFPLPELATAKEDDATTMMENTSFPNDPSNHPEQAIPSANPLLNFDNLPPAIADIVQRKPHLWEQVQAMQASSSAQPTQPREPTEGESVLR